MTSAPHPPPPAYRQWRQGCVAAGPFPAPLACPSRLTPGSGRPPDLSVSPARMSLLLKGSHSHPPSFLFDLRVRVLSVPGTPCPPGSNSQDTSLTTTLPLRSPRGLPTSSQTLSCWDRHSCLPIGPLRLSCFASDLLRHYALGPECLPSTVQIRDCFLLVPTRPSSSDVKGTNSME